MEGQDVHLETHEYSREELDEGTSDNKSEPSDEEFCNFSQMHSALESEERGLDNVADEASPKDVLFDADSSALPPEPKEREDEEAEADLLGLHSAPLTAETTTGPGEMKGSSSNAALLGNLFADNLFQDDSKADIQTANLLGSGENYFFGKQPSAESSSLFNVTNSVSGMQYYIYNFIFLLVEIGCIQFYTFHV